MALEPVKWQYPYEITLYIFKYLDLPALCRSAQVCGAWASVAKDPRLWTEGFRQIKGAATLASPTVYLQFPHPNLMRIFEQHVMTYSSRELYITSLCEDKAVSVTVPFDLQEVIWLSCKQAGLVGPNQIALLDVANGQLLCTHSKADMVSIHEQFTLLRSEGGLLVQEHGKEPVVRLAIDGNYIASNSAGDFLAVVNQSGALHRITLFNWRSGARLFRGVATRIPVFEVFADGRILLELTEPAENGGAFSGIYMHETGDVHLKRGTLTIDSEELPLRERDYFLVFSGSNKVTAYSMVDATSVLSFQGNRDLVCATVWKDRMLVYSENKCLYILDLKSGDCIFSKQILMESTLGDTSEMDNISHDVLAVRSAQKIILIDVLHGRVLQEIDAPEPSDLYFAGSILREVRRSDHMIIERKFF